MKRIRESVVTVGNFDGVHLGHQSIVRALVEEARRRGLPSAAIVFDPHPTVVLGTKVPPLLTRIPDRAKLLEGLGVEQVLIQKFTEELVETSAETYVRELADRLGMKVLCLGPTTHLGKGREGTPERVEELGRKLGFVVLVAPKFFLDGELVSSSRVRRCIEEGEVERAAQLLGRFYRIEGKVVAGDGRGRTLGFPTANLSKIPTLVPGRGVYAVWAEINGRRTPAAANVGFRPTVKEFPRFTVEIHLLGFEGSLLGRQLPVEWVARLRDERKFGSLGALKEQISKDCAAARFCLGTP